MRSLRVVLLVAAIAATASRASAQPVPAPAPETPEPAPETPAPAPAEPTDEELLRMAEQGEVIVIWAERPDKPFDRDTEVRLTGEELAARGATDLATALALLPDVSVRDVGRGGFNIDVRGSRKGAVRILIDGVSVSDPYYGTFDVSTIPVTDIVQIRVSTSPASPIDGPGGPGGVVEVHTRDAIGGRLIIGRVTSDTLPTLGASATGRAPITDRWAARLSLTSQLGLQEYDTATEGVAVEDRRRNATGGFRLEYRRGARRFAIDGFADTRRFVSPPSDELATALILLIDRETSGRVTLAYDDELTHDPAWKVSAQSWFDVIDRVSRNFRDPELTDQASGEELTAMRAGGMVLTTRPIDKRWRWVASAHIDHDRASVETRSGTAAPIDTDGESTITEGAAGIQFEEGRFRAMADAGVAVPLGLGADPWPEGKLTARYQPIDELELAAIGARKGRVPSLRERYEGADANQSLDPEMAWHGEVRVTAHPIERIDVTVAPYYRYTTGTVKIDPADNMGLINLGELRIRGVDTSATARIHRTLELGGSYQYARARSDDLGPDPLDRFPEHRADGWGRVMPLRWLSALVRARYSGRGIDRSMTTPAYVVWDASVTGNLGGDWIGVVKVDDILDVAPETRNGFRLPGRVISLVVQGTWD